MRRIKDERIASGYWTPEQIEAVNRSYETDAFLNDDQAQAAIGEAFAESWQDGRRNVSATISGTLNRIVFDPVRAVVGGVPWWLWLVGLAFALWYFGLWRGLSKWLKSKV